MNAIKNIASYAYEVGAEGLFLIKNSLEMACGDGEHCCCAVHQFKAMHLLQTREMLHQHVGL